MIDGESFQDSARKRLATTKRKIAKAVKNQAIEELNKKNKKSEASQKKINEESRLLVA